MAFFWRKMTHDKISFIHQTLQITLLKSTSGVFSFFAVRVNNPQKRASSHVFSGRKGSLAVEASVVLPLFLFFFLNLISILQLLSCYGRIEAALHQTARKWALYAYADQEKEKGAGILAAAMLPGELEKYMGTEYLEHSPVIGGKNGLFCLLSQIPDEEENIDLIVSYQVTPVFALPGFSKITMMNRCRIRAWTGYDVHAGQEKTQTGEEIVYRTEQGTVYHRSRECTHLKLSVQSVSEKNLAELRNADGGKYSPCEKCGKEGAGGNYYITEWGDRYHGSLGCSGLKRQILAVPLSQVNGMEVCSRCGGQ